MLWNERICWKLRFRPLLYEGLQIDEFYHLENAKKYHLALQRMAGKKVVENLNLVQVNNVLLDKSSGGRK